MYRRALQEISATPYAMRGSDTDSNLLMIPNSFLTPSPDEQVIQQRSRRIVARAVALQYENIERSIEFVRTPSKEGGLSQLSRKRLLLTPPDSSCKCTKAKRPKLAKKGKKTLLKSELTAYSTHQLVNVIDKLVEDHPELEKEVRDTLQQPDIKPLEENLLFLRKNVYRALPTNRWETSRDAYAYKQVKLHLESFKKTCISQGRKLVLSRSWEATVGYILAAWKFVYQLPDWDNPSHNTIKIMCFRTLAAQCMVAVKHGRFAQGTLQDLLSGLESAAAMNSEMQPCINQIVKLLI